MSFTPSFTSFDNQPLDELDPMPDEEFAQVWKQKYRIKRSEFSQDTARWLRLLRYFHPRSLYDQWQDSKGNALPKLRRSQGRSLEIYNWVRPIIEVYGSLLSGQKPMPFTIDVPPFDAKSNLSRTRADIQEKVLTEEMFRQKIPLHFQDFVTSMVLFGIAYVFSYVDPDTKKLKTQVAHWPGDVLPQWSSDRYGSGADGVESVIITERIQLDMAQRLYPDKAKLFKPTLAIASEENRPNASTLFSNQLNSVHLLKIWWRNKDKIGYAEMDYESAVVLYRDDDTGYPDIPMRWAARFPTPGEPPHRSAGVVDDVVGINTEYNERLSAFADLLMNIADPKYIGQNMNPMTVPRLAEGSNIYPVGAGQNLLPLRETVNNFPFDSFLSRLETVMLTTSGLSRLMMGTIPPGETSGEALNNLLHAAIARLEIVRTPIEWAWKSLMGDIWVPLLVEYGSDDPLASVPNRSAYAQLFEAFTHVDWGWPDITPRDALKNAQVAMALAQQGIISDESARKRVGVLSPVDEVEQIRQQRQDPILHPNDVQATALAEQAQATIAAQSTAQGQPSPEGQPGAATSPNAGGGSGTPLSAIEDQASQLSFRQFQQERAPRPPIMVPARTAPVPVAPPVPGSAANGRQGFGSGSQPR